LQEGTVSTGAQTFAGRKQFNNGVSIIDSTGGSDVALVVQDSGVSGGTHIQEWWTSGVTPIASIDTQPVLRLGIPGGADGFLELCSAVASSQTVQLACGVGATQAQILRFPKTQPSTGQVLQVQTGGADAQLQWGTGGTGAGYSQIQEDGTNLTLRSILNFAGTGFTAADDGTRTTLTLFPASATQDGIVNNLVQTFTGRKTFNVGATMQSIASVEPVLTCKLIAGGGTSARVQEWQNSSATVLAYVDTAFNMACNVLPDVDITRHLGNSALRWVEVGTAQITWNSSNVRDIISTATPVGSIAAPVGTVCRNVNGTAGQTLFVKETGTGTAGWAAVSAPGGSAGTGTNNTLARWTTSSGILADAGIIDDVAGTGFGGGGGAPTGIKLQRDFLFGRADATLNLGDGSTRISSVYIANAFWMSISSTNPAGPTTMGFLTSAASNPNATYSRYLVCGGGNYIQAGRTGTSNLAGRMTLGSYHAIELRGSRRTASSGDISTTSADGYGTLIWQEGAVNTIVPLIVGSQLALVGDLTEWQNNSVEKAAINGEGSLRCGGIGGRVVQVNPGGGTTLNLNQAPYLDAHFLIFEMVNGSFTVILPPLSALIDGREYYFLMKSKTAGNILHVMTQGSPVQNYINEIAITTVPWDLHNTSNAERFSMWVADYANNNWRLVFFGLSP
jgi:hypothetical protein